MNNTPDSPAQTPDDRTDQGGNYWTLFTPGIWKLLHAVSQLIPRITARHDTALDEGGQANRGKARVRVTFTDGTQLESFRLKSRAILEPQSNAEVAAKYRALTDGLVTLERQAAIEDAVMNLENLPDIAPLVGLLASPAQAAFGWKHERCRRTAKEAAWRRHGR